MGIFASENQGNALYLDFALFMQCKNRVLPQIAKDLILWANFGLQDVEKQRERRKTKAKEGRKKKEETWRHEKPLPFWWAFFLAHLNYKTREKLSFLTKKVPTS